MSWTDNNGKDSIQDPKISAFNLHLFRRTNKKVPLRCRPKKRSSPSKINALHLKKTLFAPAMKTNTHLQKTPIWESDEIIYCIQFWVKSLVQAWAARCPTLPCRSIWSNMVWMKSPQPRISLMRLVGEQESSRNDLATSLSIPDTKQCQTMPSAKQHFIAGIE